MAATTGAPHDPETEPTQIVTLWPTAAPEQAAAEGVVELDAELDILEAQIYRTLSIRPAVEGVARRAEALNLHRQRLRAELLLADLASRGGQAETALATQVLLRAEAASLGERDLVRRANTYLASTHDRLGHREETMTCALSGLQELTEHPGVQDPCRLDAPAWRAEALMVLTLMSMSRPGAAVELMNRAQEAVQESCAPVVIAATEANFAEVAAEVGRPDLAASMAQAASDTLARHPEAEGVLTWESIARGRLSADDLVGAVAAIDRALLIEPLLGVCDSNGDPWLTAAELFWRQNRPTDGLAVLSSAKRPTRLSMSTRARELRVRGQLFAALERWAEAYAALAEHLELWERIRNLEGDQYVEQVQSRVAAAQERERARQFEMLARTDALTGLQNRRGLDHWLSEVAVDADTPMVLAMVDVDHFKLVNDRYSHEVGDQVLRRLAGCLSALMTDLVADPSALVARLGGEEFLLAWRVDSLERAVTQADALRVGVAAYPWAEAAPGLEVTVSLGLTLVVDAIDLAGTSRPALARADIALYAAKAAGRNAVRTG